MPVYRQTDSACPSNNYAPGDSHSDITIIVHEVHSDSKNVETKNLANRTSQDCT